MTNMKSIANQQPASSVALTYTSCNGTVVAKDQSSSTTSRSATTTSPSPSIPLQSLTSPDSGIIAGTGYLHPYNNQHPHHNLQIQSSSASTNIKLTVSRVISDPLSTSSLTTVTPTTTDITDGTLSSYSISSDGEVSGGTGGNSTTKAAYRNRNFRRKPSKPIKLIPIISISKVQQKQKKIKPHREEEY